MLILRSRFARSRFALVSIFSVLGAGIVLSTAMPQASAQVSSADTTDVTVSSAGSFELLLAQAAAESPRGSVVDVAGRGRSFKTLVKAVEAAGLADKLSSDGPFTILAPTDRAFDELPKGVVDALLKPENKDLLTQVLTYHVVPEELKFNQFRSGALATLNGGLAVKLTSERIIINNASIIQADVEADNGIIQVISRVLIPPSVAEELQARTPETTTVVDEPDVAEEVTEAAKEKPSVRGLW